MEHQQMSSAMLQIAAGGAQNNHDSVQPTSHAQGFPEQGWNKKVSPHSIDVAGIKAESSNIDNILASISGNNDAFLSAAKENNFLNQDILSASATFEHANINGGGLPDEMNTAGDMGAHNTSFIHNANMGDNLNARDGGGVKS